MELLPRKTCNRCRRARPAELFIDKATGTKRRSCESCRPVVKVTKSGDTYLQKTPDKCKQCGCDWKNPCSDSASGSPCFWVTPSKDLCSCCARKMVGTAPPVSSPGTLVITAPPVAEPQGECDGPL